MGWEWLNLIGAVAFATSGATVAMEEGYDLLGVIFLGFSTAFGGGILRSMLLGEPAPVLWQEWLLLVALAAVLLIFCLPRRLIQRWNQLAILFDAVGLAAFSLQAAILATNKGFPFVAVLLSALLTGAGGGIIRDLLAGRKPFVFQTREPLYGVFAVAVAALIFLGWPQQEGALAFLLALVVSLRMASVHWKWRLPRRQLELADGCS